MKRVVYCLGVIMALTASMSKASDPVGIYTLVDKVVLEPNESAPERIQVWGAFSLAEGRGDTYATAARGYMYFTLLKGKEDVCRREWTDLKKIAGTRQCVGFGSRWNEKGRIRKANEKLESPDVYPLASGVFKVRTDNDYPPIKALLSLPTS